jgi:hypothetical protein
MNENLDRSISNFLKLWGSTNKPSLELVDDYLLICRELPKADESSFLDVISVVKRNAEMWAFEHSEVYLKSKPFYSKDDLEDKISWYVASVAQDSANTHTSGSSTGFHFMYRRMKSTFERLEWDNHYDMVLDEFGIKESPNILYFFPDHFKKSGDLPVFVDPGPQPYLNSHGRSRRSIVHYANFDMYKSDPSLFFRALFDYVFTHPIDVFFSSGPQINSLCHHIRKFGFKDRIGGLLSHTNEMLMQDDAEFLFVENKYFDSICDHMRCWDGGASFFTCKFGNYHLMDNLSWCDEVEGRLISTDYFNFASPFVKYWNGDMCSISKKIDRCECGRLFREFEFLENRPFSLAGVCLGSLRSKMISLGIDGIKQVKCYVDSINVVSSRPLSFLEKSSISALETSFSFIFSVEEELS